MTLYFPLSISHSISLPKSFPSPLTPKSRSKTSPPNVKHDNWCSSGCCVTYFVKHLKAIVLQFKWNCLSNWFNWFRAPFRSLFSVMCIQFFFLFSFFLEAFDRSGWDKGGDSDWISNAEEEIGGRKRRSFMTYLEVSQERFQKKSKIELEIE